MKILLAHNDYGKYSGEEAVVDQMNRLFKNLGYEVAQLRMTTANVRDSLRGKIRGIISGIYSPKGVRAMREALQKEKPDVVNVHNLYPFISPAALRECRKASVPVIMTVHNYRLMCPTGLFYRDNRPCELCLKNGNEWSCIKYNCENSGLKSLGYALRNYVARVKRYYHDCVDYFACLTEFQKNKLIEAGFDPQKIVVIPNSIDIPAHSDSRTFNKTYGDYVAYSGRISREKGVDMIIEVARRHPEIPFKFAGSVRDRELVENIPSNVELKGYLEGDELKNFFSNASFFVMASRWYEGFPMTILETGLFGKPVIVPDHGGFTEIAETLGNNEIIEGDKTGMLFEPGNIDDLEESVVNLWNNPIKFKQTGMIASEKIKACYSSEAVSNIWKNLIESLMSNPRKSGV